MYSKLDWFLAIIRIAGASFPGATSLVQLQAEIDTDDMKERITKLEDPISLLHEDVPKVSKIIYKKLKEENAIILEFNDEFYDKFSKPLAVLASKDFINAHHTIGNRYQGGIGLSDPSFIMYLCAIAEEYKKMEALHEILEECKIGDWINGKEIDIDLPLPVIRAIFEIYESNGYGICSNEVGTCQYLCKA